MRPELSAKRRKPGAVAWRSSSPRLQVRSGATAAKLRRPCADEAFEPLREMGRRGEARRDGDVEDRLIGIKQQLARPIDAQHQVIACRRGVEIPQEEPLQ